MGWGGGGLIGSLKKKKTRLLKEELRLGDFNLEGVGLDWIGLEILDIL